jgi:hypothetical protein
MTDGPDQAAPDCKLEGRPAGYSGDRATTMEQFPSNIGLAAEFSNSVWATFYRPIVTADH